MPTETRIKLPQKDKLFLQRELKKTRLAPRERVRSRILLMSHEKCSRAEIVRALNTTTPTISRTRKKYVDEGLEAAVYEPVGNRGRARVLSVADEQLIASMACTDPPDGEARWTAALLLKEGRVRGLPQVSLETIRRCLHSHDIKPWLEKNVGHSRANA